MAVRVRKNGNILCAAIHEEEPDDIYIDDELHYYLSVIEKVLVTESYENHKKHGKWWWRDKIPKDIIIDDFYKIRI